MKRYANSLEYTISQKEEEIELFKTHIQAHENEKTILESTKAKLQQSLEESRAKGSSRAKSEKEDLLENEINRLNSLLLQANSLSEERERKIGDLESENEELLIREKNQIKTMKQMESDHLVEKNRLLREVSWLFF